MRIIVGCLVLKKNKFVIVKEAKKSCYGEWNLPLGHLEENEIIIDGAKRESEEETGLKLELKGFIGIYQHKSKTDGKSVIKIIFEADTDDDKLKVPKEEILDAKWVSLEEFNQIPEKEIRNLDIRTVINDYFKKGSLNLDYIKINSLLKK